MLYYFNYINEKNTISISFYNYGNWDKKYVYLVHIYIYSIYIIYIQIHFIIEMCNYSISQWSPREKGVTLSCCQLDGWLRRCRVTTQLEICKFCMMVKMVNLSRNSKLSVCAMEHYWLLSSTLQDKTLGNNSPEPLPNKVNGKSHDDFQ